MSAIGGNRRLGTSTGAAWGIAMMAATFIFPHMPRVLAALSFDIGGVVAASCLILLLVE
jgi:hypothetical protein